MGKTVCNDTEIGKPERLGEPSYLRNAAGNPIALSTALRTIKNAIGALRGLNGRINRQRRDDV